MSGFTRGLIKTFCAVLILLSLVGCVGTTATVTTVAGVSMLGDTDAVGTDASFGFPSDIVVDSKGNIFVADTLNDKIRKITPTGVVSTFAGDGSYGSVDGVGTNASFNYPSGLAIDKSDNLFIADSANHKIRKITPSGVVSTIAGSGVTGDRDAVGKNASFNFPYDIVIDNNDNLFIADLDNYKIRKITPSGVVSTIAGSGVAGDIDAVGKNASFNSLYTIAIDRDNNLFVADALKGTIRKITPSGAVSTLINSSASGHPYGIVVDSNSNLFTTDVKNHKIRKITSAGIVSTIAGSGVVGSTDGVGTDASFNFPSGIAIDKSGNLLIADMLNSKIRKITPTKAVSTIAGVNSHGSVDGVGVDARFNAPLGIALDSNNNLFVADTKNHKIRKITPSGVVSTFVGSGVVGSADGVGADTSFNYPSGLAIDKSDNLFIADSANHKIRKITPSGVVSTIAGSGVSGDRDSVGKKASFNFPFDIAVDSSGNLFVADSSNHKVRKITPIGVVSTVAGSGTLGDIDAVGVDANFNFPSALTIDSNDNIFVADLDNHKIRKITPTGVVSTFVDGSIDASFNLPYGITIDSNNNLFVTDLESHNIRKITPSKVISTVAGSGVAGSADGVGIEASFNAPTALVADNSGNIFVADSSSNTIRKISTK